jgi:ribose transport system ATP-binding protein
MSQAALACRGIAKAFGGVPVLKDVSLALEPGTITALAGENGAGKSTFMKVAAGQVRADRGEVDVHGRPLAAADPRAAHALGVAIVPQELAPILDMRVYENLFVGRELRGRLGTLDRRRMADEARDALAVFGLDIDVQARMRDMSVALRQMVEIVKCTSRGARVLLLDEPTSAIAEREAERLFGVLRALRERGVAMLYTTHKMAEIRAIADRVVVLRDGQLVEDRPVEAIDDDAIVEAMIGRELQDLFPGVREAGDDVALEVEGLQVEGAARPLSLVARRGEVLGLAGLVGAGRTELLEAIFGVRRTTAGTIRVAGRPVRRGSPAAAIAAGMALVPEDRKGAGLVLSMSVLDNGSLPRLGSFSAGGWVRQRRRQEAVGGALRAVRLRSRSPRQQVATLSGGNQQKVVLARWLTEHVDVLLLDEPTRGVDIGARSEIYRVIADLAASGMAVVMASSDMLEVLSLSHRVLVMARGRVAGELTRAELDDPGVQDRIFRLSAGIATPAKETA